MSTVLAGLIRHALTALGGGLITSNWLSGDELNLAIGAVVTLAGIGWSVIEKKRRR